MRGVMAADDRPLLLMLSHCAPDALGEAGRARAWQLLRLASQTHRVHLACAVDAPVNLRQWRALHQLTAQVALEPAPLLWRLARGPAPAWDVAGASLSSHAALMRVLGRWLRHRSFDAVLCTHPALWPDALAVPARQRLCDLPRPATFPLSADLRTAEGRGEGLLRVWRHVSITKAWRRWLTRRAQQARELLAAQCDILTLADPQCLPAGLRPRRTLLVPDAVDIDCYAVEGDDWFLDGAQQGGAFDAGPALRSLAVSAADEPPAFAGAAPSSAPPPPATPLRLVVHAAAPPPRRHGPLEWFAHEVWPAVRQAVPEVALTCTPTSHAADPLAELRCASVVVLPDRDPDEARWPLLQALALRRPVITSARAAAGLDLRDGEHLLLTRDPHDWSACCVELLRSAGSRLRLASGGRRFVERHYPLARTGRPLTETLARRAADSPELVLAKAA